ncbi:multiple sugar transport system substrate-binding protein [Rhodobium orientis]|uniref:Bicyclomycin resistance protein n=1 Tax=Rhodobium orientis TaxID=34017 RepID=A0A327JXH3_9HYPH|nr:extracellular solute-binding protein [Rhodobium orientis]MBB4300995.1 multiple sugar transport system substrate-binding protein [Rhodobium orientis]MBK5949662.1 bicyclomycin resistance protein [Rhodobium orientis]RAI30213.1 bicyclomycin resistance protein [Rhodobium orientis]
MKNVLKMGISAIALTVFASGALAENIVYWTPEVQPKRMEIQQAVAEAFTKKTGHTVEIVPVEENELGPRATAAYAAGDLPDVMMMPIGDVLPFAEEGILDIDTNNDVVDDLGRGTFSEGVLGMTETDGVASAVPFSAWPYITIYRKSRFEELGLAQPTSFETVLAAAKALHNPPKVHGFAVATKVDEGFMSQTLEQLFLANGVSPVKEDGTVDFDQEKTKEVLEFYKALKEMSPEGELYWKQTRETYFNGTVEFTFWSPFILDEMAGLRDAAPVAINDDPTTRALSDDTEVLTGLAGPSNPDGATWVELTVFGITTDAKTDAAMEFVKFMMSDGYMDMLAIAPEGLFPVRTGSEEGKSDYVDGWAKLEVGVDRRAPLGDLYPPETIQAMVDGLSVGTRWGVAEGQLSLASKIINSGLVNRLVREYADGARDADATVDLLNEEASAIK